VYFIFSLIAPTQYWLKAGHIRFSGKSQIPVGAAATVAAKGIAHPW